MTVGQEYRGKGINITFDGKKCIHSRNCVLGQPKVFQANVKGPWINPDNASVEDLAALAKTCPSGAITFKRNDGGAEEYAPEANVVRILENGPYAVHADIQIDGRQVIRATLCRCGASKYKPYCDGAHKGAGFQATGEAPTQDSEPLAERGGPLEFSTVKNGPLMASGNMEIIAGSGRTVSRAKKAAFCRCGASNNKPYCDGSHKEAGFEAD